MYLARCRCMPYLWILFFASVVFTSARSSQLCNHTPLDFLLSSPQLSSHHGSGRSSYVCLLHVFQFSQCSPDQYTHLFDALNCGFPGYFSRFRL
ncbi:hypothetical protein BJ165DRAFT_1474296 [Panaeolus papilionaceus]|nr:hypothetical protein BJ165DRAFT_1474296 [Panaeolus papilionaceus]